MNKILKYEVTLNVGVQYNTIILAKDESEAYDKAIEEMKKEQINNCDYWEVTSSDTKERW